MTITPSYSSGQGADRSSAATAVAKDLLRECQGLGLLVPAHSDHLQQLLFGSLDDAATACVTAHLTQRIADKRRVVNLRQIAMTTELEAVESQRNDTGGARAATDGLRNAVESKADELMGVAQASLTNWLGARGNLAQAVLSQVQQLSAADFEIETSYSRLICRLSPRVSSDIKIKFLQNAKELFRAASKAAQDAVTALEADFFTRCKVLGFERLGYAPSQADSERAWGVIKGQLEVPVDFKFEQPKRGFLKRLSEGKQMLSTVMMALTLAGMMAGFQWRKSTEILYALPLVFIAGMVYSFYSWKQEDEEYISKELERIRESMTRDLSRTLSESERAIVTYLRACITNAAKHLQQFAEQKLREAASKESNDSADRRTRLRDQTRRLDSDLRSLDQSLQRGRSTR